LNIIHFLNFLSLGGTSLINANVALETDERVWRQSAWPKEIHEDMESIKRCMYNVMKKKIIIIIIIMMMMHNSRLR